MARDFSEPAAPPGAQDVADAAARIKGRLARTPLIKAEKLSRAFKADIWLKLENLQYTGAFKERGALNRLLLLDEDERARGVIAASAGNHAQGVAYHAGALDIDATIVMPKTTPDVKVRETRALGANVVLHGMTFDEAHQKALKIQGDENRLYVHPFDHPSIIAGQGTLALEMLEDGPRFDAVIAPIGGGGLISGMAIAIKDRAPETRVLGVQSSLFPSMANAIRDEDAPVGGNTLAEGIAVKQAGALTRRIVAEHVDDIILVDERCLERATQHADE